MERNSLVSRYIFLNSETRKTCLTTIFFPYNRNAAEATIQVLHSNRLTNKTTIVFIAELKNFLANVMIHINDELNSHAHFNDILSSYSRRTEKKLSWISRILGRLFSLTYIVISPFFLSHKRNFDQIRDYLRDEELYDHLYEYIHEPGQSNMPWRSCSSQRENQHFIMPFDLLPSLFHSMISIEKNHEKMIDLMSKSEKQSIKSQKKPSYCVIKSFLFPHSDTTYGNSRMARDYILSNYNSNINPTLLPSLMTVASECATFLSYRNWATLYHTISNCLNVSKKSSEETHNEMISKNGVAREGNEIFMIVPSDYASLMRQCILMMLVVTSDISLDLNQIPKEVSCTYETNTFSSNENVEGNAKVLIDSKNSTCLYELKWERLVFKIYFKAAVCGVEGTLETVVTVLRSVLAQSTPPKIITSLIEYVKYALNLKVNKCTSLNENLCCGGSEVVTGKGDEIPTWVYSNILLLIFHSQKSPRKVFRLTAALMGIDENVTDHVSRILTLLTDLAISKSNAVFNLAQCHRNYSRRSSLKKKFSTRQQANELEFNSLEFINFLDLFRIVCYKGKCLCEINVGSTCGINSENIKWNSSILNALCNLASACTTLVYESLFQGGDANDDPCSISSELGFAWTEAAYKMLSQNWMDIRMSATIFAIFTLVCVYWNIPSSRQSIVRNIILGLTNESTGYNSLEKIKYCTICHILVSSVVRNHHSNFPDAFDDFNKEREGRGSCGSELTSLSDLLASSSTVNLSPFISKRLLHAFLPLPCARGNIFTMCQKSFSPKLTGLSFDSVESNNIVKRKVLRRNLALQGLCGLIMINDDKKVVCDEIGNDALKILRGIIFLKKPPIPPSAQMFLYQMLANMATPKTHNSWTLSSGTVLLLFRSCLSALLCYFTTEYISSEEDLMILCMEFINDGDGCRLGLNKKIQSTLRFAPCRCVLTITEGSTPNKHNFALCDDVLNLIKLTFTLYSRLLKSRRSSRIDNGGISTLQKIILRLSEKMNDQNTRQSFDPDEFVTSTSSTPELYVLDVIYLTCISKILNFTLYGETTQQNHNKATISKECTSLQEFLSVDEFKELRKSNIYENNKHFTNRMRSSSLSNPDAFFMLRSSLSKLFQIGISIERDSTYQSEPNKSKDWKRLCNLFLLLNHHTLHHHNAQTKKAGQSIHLNNEFSYEEFHLARSFIFALSNSVLNFNINESNYTKSHLSCEFFKVIVEHCDTIAKGFGSMNNEQGVTSSDMIVHNFSIFYVDSIDVYIKITNSLWKLYSGLCCEENLKTIINVIQNNGSNDVSNSEMSGEMDFLGKNIRSLRFNILKALQSSMFIGLKRRSTLHQSLHGLLRHDDIHAEIEHNICFEMVDKIAKDLSVGLEGHSGSISPDLYMMFLNTIQEAINIISFYMEEICLKVDFKIIKKYNSIAVNTSFVLWCILSRYGLKQALLIKSTLKMTLSTLPLLSQRLGRRVNVDEVLPMDMKTTAIEALMQCLDVLQTWHFLDPSRNIQHSWKEVFGNEKNCHNEKNTKFIHKIKMISPDVWNWTMDTAFLAIDLNWNESSSIIQQKIEGQNMPQILGESYITQFCVTRMKDLAATMNVLLRVLGDVNSADTEKDKKCFMDEVDHSLEIPLCAELLPDQCKVRLCKCLDRVFVTMKNACLCAIRSLKETHPSRKFTASLLESIICLATLFQNSLSCVSNIAHGTRLWAYKEKKVFSSIKTNLYEKEYHVDENRILRRLPSTLFQVNGFEIALQNLLDVVASLENSFLGEYDVLFSMIMEKEPEEGMMHSLLTKYIKVYSSNESRSQIANKIAREKGMDYDNITAIQNGRFSKLTRLERKWSNRTIHGTHQQILRSRNQVVDEWLELDKDLSTDEEEFGDAFVDLEDFLENG